MAIKGTDMQIAVVRRRTIAAGVGAAPRRPDRTMPATGLMPFRVWTA